MREVRENYLRNLRVRTEFWTMKLEFQVNEYYTETKPFLNKVLVAEIQIYSMTEL